MLNASRVIGVLGLSVAAIAFSRSPLVAGSARMDESCGNIESLGCGGGGAHRVPGLGFGRQITHDDCLICTAGDAALCHPGCNASFAPAVKARYDALLAAAGRQDAGVVLSLSDGLEDFVFFNEDREAIQVRDCQAESIIANIPVEREMARIASRQLLVMRGGTMSTHVAVAVAR